MAFMLIVVHVILAQQVATNVQVAQVAALAKDQPIK